jgi:hypothetical protein
LKIANLVVIHLDYIACQLRFGNIVYLLYLRMLSISATFFLTERGYTFKRARRAGIKVRVMAVRLTQREASVSRVASGIQESTGFSKNIKKLSTLIIGDRGCS